LVYTRAVVSSSLHQPPGDRHAEARFPEVVRLRHFIVLPAFAMAAVIVISRTVESALAGRLGPFATDVFQVSRTVFIALVMASVIGWLAVRYRRRYEIQLRARNRELEGIQEFLSSIIRDSAEGIVTLDVENRITSWNRAAESIFGWTAREVEGMSVDRLLPDDARIVEERRRVDERLRAGEIVRDHETTRLRKDGKSISVRISWSPLHDASASIIGAIGIVLDVTVQREMRERLVERERLAAVGEMAAHVAHEVRNPLAGIRASCEMLFKRKEDPEHAAEIGDEVVHQIDRLNQTVSDLLMFAAPRTIKVVPTDLDLLIDRVILLFREDPATRAVRIERIRRSETQRAHLDPLQFEQVMYNLLLNAVQAMKYQGCITVSTEVGERGVEITVHDSGPGLPPDVGDRLFKPFYTTRTEGTGLGLAIVKKIVTAHGGSIEASNRPEGGAEFRIRLAGEPPVR